MAERLRPGRRRHAAPAAANARHSSEGYAPDASARDEPSVKVPAARSGCAMYRSHSVHRRAERCWRCAAMPGEQSSVVNFWNGLPSAH